VGSCKYSGQPAGFGATVLVKVMCLSKYSCKYSSYVPNLNADFITKKSLYSQSSQMLE
jgi:hypothetical protein